MKKLLYVLLLFSVGAYAQNTEGQNTTLINIIRTSGLTPARVANALDGLNLSKVSIKGIYTASGTNTYSVTAGAGIINLDNDIQIIVKFTNANTSSTVSLNVNGLGAQSLKTNLGADPDVGGISAGSIYLLGTTGSTWRIIGPTNEGGTAVTNWGDIPTGNLDDQTDLYDSLGVKARKIYKIKPIATNYSASLGDHDNKFVIIGGGSTFTIPKDADVNFPIGASLLYGDSLETATFTKDPAVHIDTLDIGVAIKLAANKWGVPRSQSGGGDFWPITGSKTLTGDVTIDGDGNSVTISNAASTPGDLILQSINSSTGSSSFLNQQATDSLFFFSFQSAAVDGDGFYSSATLQSEASQNSARLKIEINHENNNFYSLIEADDRGFFITTSDSVRIIGPSSERRLDIWPSGELVLEHTNTAGGTTGNRTINKMSGTVNFAAGASSLTVTNSLCTTSSIVFAAVRTNDTTAIIKNVTPGSGSFVIRLNAVTTAETSVGFFIIN